MNILYDFSGSTESSCSSVLSQSKVYLTPSNNLTIRFLGVKNDTKSLLVSAFAIKFITLVDGTYGFFCVFCLFLFVCFVYLYPIVVLNELQ